MVAVDQAIDRGPSLGRRLDGYNPELDIVAGEGQGCPDAGQLLRAALRLGAGQRVDGADHEGGPGQGI